MASPSKALVVGKQYTCNRDCIAEYEQCVSCKRGDVLTLLEEQRDEYWVYVLTQDGREGFAHVEEIQITSDLQNYEWYFGNTTRAECEAALKQPPLVVGRFMVRNTSSQPGYVSVSVLVEGLKVVHQLMPQNDPQLYTELGDDGRLFSDLPSFIAYCKEKPWGNLGKLTVPCGKPEPNYELPPNLIPLEAKRESLQFGNKIGEGKYGKVFKGTFSDVHLPVAIKQSKMKIPNAEEFSNVARSMKKLNHRNVVHLYSVVSGRPICIITEYMTNGSLLSFLRQNNQNEISFELQLHMSIQIAKGMEYLEDMLFVHGDLRAARVMVGDNFVCKVDCSFLSRCFRDDVYNVVDDQLCVEWAAPEVIEMNQFSHKSDVWSFGVLLYEILTNGAKPYEGLSATDVRQFVTRRRILDKPAGCNDSMYQRMKQCWAFNANNRPAFKDTAEHLQMLLSSFDKVTKPRRSLP